MDLQATVPAIATAYETVIAEVASSQDENTEQLLIWQEIAP
jgi:hypothetical protein